MYALGCAQRESREEAGVTGKINRRAIGSFSYEKRLKGGKVVVCEVQVFVLKVKRQQATWLEKGELPPAIGVWWVHAVALSLGFYLLMRDARKA